jgi:chromate reductase, NAD(P)H dehydrogenase (quinone)
MRVLGISGSLRVGSLNTALIRAAATMLPPEAELVIYDDLARLPPYSEETDVEPPPADVERFRSAVASADAVLIATPEYNGSLPGQLKNALDWGSRPRGTAPFEGKPVAVVGASPGLFGAVWAQADTRRILGVMGAKVLERELPVSQAKDRFDADGHLVDDEIAGALEEIVRDLLPIPTLAEMG